MIGGVLRVAASVVVAAGFLSAGGSGRAEPDGHGANFLLFAGTDLWRNGGFVHGGLLWSPDGIDRDGFTFKLLLGGGVYRYTSGALGGAEVTGGQLLASAMAGWRFKRDGFEATIFVGPDVQDHRLRPDDPGSRLRGLHLGLRAGADLWYEPTQSLMAAANASFATVAWEYSVRVAIGWRLFDRLFVGPEAQALGCDNYRQLRLGIHATGLQTGTLEWSAGLGWARDSDERSGAYGRIGVIARR